MSLSFGGQKSSTSQTGTQNVDAQTAEYMRRVMEAAKAAGGAGPSPLTTGASDFFTQMQNRGNFGMGALAGDPAAAQTLMNPYQRQVIDANNAEWTNTNLGTMNAVNDAATKANAFGGSRHGVATGVALGENNRAQMMQNAGLLSSGFENAMGRAGQLAGMGFQGAQSNANLGMGGVGSPEQWLMQMLKQGYMGPMGQTSSMSGRQSGMGFQAGTDNLFKMFG